MTVKSYVGRLCAALAVVTLASSAFATEVVLEIDLSVVDQITISATDGVSDVTTTGSDSVGAYMENFYAAAGNSLSASLVTGDFSNAENATDNSPSIFRADSGGDLGLNIWSWSDASDVSFTAGSLAFVGSGTWTVSSDMYADMLAGNTSGNVYFPADDVSDLGTAEIIGTYVVIPEPGTMALLGLVFGIGALRRR